MTLASVAGTVVRRRPATLLLAAVLAVVLALGALAWQIDEGRGRMLGLLEQELAAMRHTVPSPSRMVGARAEFDRLHSAMAWRLRAATALGLLGLGLAVPLVLAAAGPTPANKPETPTAIAGAKVVGVEEAKSLAGARAAVFVDTRNPMNFGKGHVPGAVTASYREKSEPVENFDASQDSFTMDKLPADKAAKLVFYSDGPTGWKSYKAAVLAVKAGYRNVMYMRGGFAEWEAKGAPVER